MRASASHLQLVPDSNQELETLFHTHAAQIYRTALRVTGNQDDAEDVLQTVFLRLAKRDELVEMVPNPQAYLLRAAINAALDIVRTRNVARLIALDDVASDLFAAGGNPETHRANRELQKLVRHELSKLSAKSAEIFILKYFEGYTNQEIAALTGSSHLVVGVLLHRARAQLKASIGSIR